MRGLYFSIVGLLFILLFIHCEVDKSPVSSTLNPYAGTWRWVKTVGGLFPRVITPDEGTTVKINYDYNHSFRLFRNDSLKVMARYEILSAEDYGDQIKYSDIKIYNYQFFQNFEYAQIDTDTLMTWDGMCDGFYSYFIRE